MVLRIFKMISTSSFLTALKCTKFVFGLGSPVPLAGLKGTNSKGGWEGERKGSKTPAPFRKFLDPLLPTFNITK